MKNRMDVKRTTGVAVAKGKEATGDGKGTRYRLGQARNPQWPLVKALRRGILGCGPWHSQAVCRAAGRRTTVKGKERKREQWDRVEQWLREHGPMGSDRKRQEVERIQRHRKRGTVRGQNRRRGLPVRGQRTKTNGMTARRRNRRRGTRV